MKTIKQVIQENPEYKSLINAVIRNIGVDSISDVNNHGIDGGYNGFVWYSDTHAFAMKYRRYIIKLLERFADELSEEITGMVANFGYFKRNGIEKDDKKDLYKYLGGGKLEQCVITNLMAWFAAEEVCRMFEV